MVNVNLPNFFAIGLMAVVFILMLKALMGLYPVDGLKELVYAV